MFGFGKKQADTPRLFERSFTPSRESDLNNFQQETEAEGDLAREAQDVAKVLGGAHRNMPGNLALRDAWKGREPEYLFGRFASAFHWDSIDQARAFYRRNR